MKSGRSSDAKTVSERFLAGRSPPLGSAVAQTVRLDPSMSIGRTTSGQKVNGKDPDSQEELTYPGKDNEREVVS